VTTVSRTTSYTVVEAEPRLSAQRGPVEFGYDARDPYAVRLVFRDGQDSATWTFARDLLADGLTGLGGTHDVACWTKGIWFHIMLSSPDGRAIFKVIAGQVRAFLIDAEDLVPYGAETAIVDAELDALLKDGAR
jgi:hypothetical protein